MRYKFRVILSFILILLFTVSVYFIFNQNRINTGIESKYKKGAPGPDARPSEWFWTQRLFPHWQADKEAYRQAFIQTNRLKSLAKKSTAVEWQFAGPSNIGGRIVDIEFNPQYPSIVYAAAATGGVFRSTDTGYNWLPVFDDQPALTIGDICVDPVDPDIIYIGTGEANGGHNNFPGGGVYKSTDGGGSWQFIGLENTVSIGRILVDPKNHQKVWVAAVGSYFAPNPERGVYLSKDGGQTWQQSLFISDSTGAIDLITDEKNPDFMLAAMWERVRRPVDYEATHLWGKTSGIYRTTDGGKNWRLIGPERGLPNAGTERVGRIGLSMHRDNSDVIYALYNDGAHISGLYRSDDGGISWKETGSTAALLQGAGGFSWYFGQVRAHPNDPDKVYALDVAFMRSIDGGQTFPLQYGYNGYAGLHVDHHALAFHPQNADYIICGNDGGINISEDGGDNWVKVGQLPVTQFYEIGIDHTDPARLYGGTQDNGSLRTPDGREDDWEQILDGDGFYVIVDYADPDIVYAEYQYGALFKITNDGQTRTYVLNNTMEEERSNWATPVVMDPEDHNTLYYGTHRIWRTIDGADNWQAISPDLTRGLTDSRVGTITTIAVAPSNTDYIYAATDDGLVWISNDYGDNWQNITGSLPFRWVTRVVVDPHNEQIAYVTFSGLKWNDPQPRIFRTVDAGENWTNITGNLPEAPVNAFAVDPFHSNVLFGGLDVGVFVSFNGGGSWEPLGTGLPTMVISDMKIHPLSYELIAGTYGRSMYRLPLEEITGLQPARQIRPGQFTLLNNYPNPFNGQTTIRFSLPDGGAVSLDLYNIRGQLVKNLMTGYRPAGTHQYLLNGAGLSSGVYLYQLKLDNGKILTKKLVLLK